MRFILIRHGETHANVLYNTEQRILIGALDTFIAQLNETGIEQASRAKEQLKNDCIDEIYSSDLGRTKQTAQIIFPDRDICYTKLLRERSLGSDEGKSIQEVFSREDVWKYHVNTEEDSIEDCLTKKVIDGESYVDVMKRCKEFLSQFNLQENKTIVIVSHFHFLRCFIYVLFKKQPDRELMRMVIPNAYPLICDLNEGKFMIKK